MKQASGWHIPSKHVAKPPKEEGKREQSELSKWIVTVFTLAGGIGAGYWWINHCDEYGEKFIQAIPILRNLFEWGQG